MFWKRVLTSERVGVGRGREQDTIADFYIRCHGYHELHCTFVVSKISLPGMHL